jgi:hypothetical protein
LRWGDGKLASQEVRRDSEHPKELGQIKSVVTVTFYVESAVYLAVKA